MNKEAWRHSVTWEPQYERRGRNEGHQEQALKGKRSFFKTQENMELQKRLKKNQT